MDMRVEDFLWLVPSQLKSGHLPIGTELFKVKVTTVAPLLVATFNKGHTL